MITHLDFPLCGDPQKTDKNLLGFTIHQLSEALF